MSNPTQRSQAQREAARRNGAKSRGPLHHPSRAVVLNSESVERYHTLLQSLLDHFAPASPAEVAAVEHFAAAEWRLRRLLSSESALLDLQIDDHRAHLSTTDTPTRTALALHDLNALDRLSRAEARLLRNQQRALLQLTQLKKMRAEPGNSLIPQQDEPGDNPSITLLTRPEVLK